MNEKKFEDVESGSANPQDSAESAAKRLRAQRRDKVLDLYAEGLTLRQIASKLGVGERTVKRDFAKVKPQIQIRREQLLEKNRRAIFAQFDKMSGAQREYALQSICSKLLESQKKRNPHPRVICVVDPEGTAKGLQGLICNPPHLSYPTNKPLPIEVHLFAQGDLKKMGELTIGR